MINDLSKFFGGDASYMIALRKKVFLLIISVLLIGPLTGYLASAQVQELQKGYMVIAYPNSVSVNTTVPILVYFFGNYTGEDAKLIDNELLRNSKWGISIENKSVDFGSRLEQATLMLIYDPANIRVQPQQDFRVNVIKDHQEFGWIVTPKKGPVQSLEIHLLSNLGNESNEVFVFPKMTVTVNQSELFNYLIYGGALLAILTLIIGYLKKDRK
jgi:hypothetical protein